MEAARGTNTETIFINRERLRLNAGPRRFLHAAGERTGVE